MTIASMPSRAAPTRMRRLGTLLLVMLALGGCGKNESDDLTGGATMSIQLSSPAFQEGGTVPRQYTGDGKNVSPPLRWTDPPVGTKSFVLICDDPDAPRGTWTHWLLFNVPDDLRELPEFLPTEAVIDGGARQGKNDFGKLGYGGPAPPAGNPHRYYFRLYALNTLLDLLGGASRGQLLAAMKGHVLAEGQLMGRYGR
jgi:Raf kinase inhibitor-like YbhB/YbcL family protein